MEATISTDCNRPKIAFLVQLPQGVSPGQRFRCENWFPYLRKHKIEYDYFPFFDQSTYEILYKKNYASKKILGTLRGFVGRISLLPKLGKYDYIFIQRESAPLGPPVFEWIISKLLKKKIIFDFDDAIWIPYRSNPVAKFFKCYWKIRFIITWSHMVVAGNDYLASYSKKWNTNTIVLPTVVDTELQHNRLKIHNNKAIPVVGWTGSHSTLPYLENFIPTLEKIYQQIPFQLLVIADRPPAKKFSNLKFIQWNPESEIEDLLLMDIGIMPLEPDEWSEGKCGFKIIQYLALGIPAVASDLGVNKSIIQIGKNGFLASSEEGWIASLKALIQSATLRTVMGLSGRNTIESDFSIQAKNHQMLGLFINEDSNTG